MPAVVEPVDEDRAKGHLRVSDDDPYIAELPGCIKAARQHVEKILNASVANQTRVATLDSFPAGVIKLPDGPVLSVTSISYIDSAGATASVDAWILSKDRLTPAYGESWPTARDQLGAVTITYEAGMMEGSPLALDDEDIINGIKLVLGDLWDNRAGQFAGTITTPNPTLMRILFPHRRNLGT